MTPTPTVDCPFTILRDNREQGPYCFTGMRTDKDQGSQLITIPTKLVCLKTGDYSIAGHQDHIAIERKSAADLFQTLGRGRDRFKRELLRMQELDASFVVVECSLEDVLLNPPVWSKMPGKVIYRTILSWHLKYPRTHWLMCGCRRLGEITTYRLLEKYWKECS